MGGIGDIDCLSFYFGKNLGAYGDAGCITTNSLDILNISKMLANNERLGSQYLMR